MNETENSVSLEEQSPSPLLKEPSLIPKENGKYQHHMEVMLSDILQSQDSFTDEQKAVIDTVRLELTPFMTRNNYYDCYERLCAVGLDWFELIIKRLKEID